MLDANTQLPPTIPFTPPATWPYYTYPVPVGSTEGAIGIPIDLVRASASEADLSNHGVHGVLEPLPARCGV